MKNRKKSRVTNSKMSYQFEEPPDKLNSSNFFSKTVLVIICIFVGFLNYYHASTLQENNVMFSHLSNLERELSFRTEMGFYYSFYKQVINAPSLYTMINLLVRDNLTEYPDTINALQRFNVYPELVLGVFYKGFVAIAPHFGISLKTCYMVNRGDLSAVESCEGLGEPAIFYVAMVMVINGAMMSGMFLLGRIISNGSMFGGLLTCACYLFNHRECTRVQWTPPLRESFSFPCLIVQQLFLVIILKKPRYSQVSLVVKVGFCVTTLMALLSWQFAQFALLTQCVALFLAYLIAARSGSDGTDDDSNSGDRHVGGADSTRFAVRNLLVLLILADLANLVLQFGNTLLLTGPLRPCLIMALLIVTLEPRSIHSRFQNSVLAPLRWLALLLCLVLSTVTLKFFIGLVLRIKSDDHMFDILRSKFSNFSSFDSQLYTCAPEFDFYDVASLPDLCKTGLLPLAGLVFLVIVGHTGIKWLKCFCNSRGDRDCVENVFSPSEFIDIADFYLVFQTVAYIVMAALIMRLKLFATPQMCILAALVAKHNWPFMRISDYVSRRLVGDRRALVWRSWSIVLVLALCSIRGVQNLRGEWEIKGSYSNWDQEQLMGFITTNTNQWDSFTGQMATMATVRLVTSRPIIIHPHYEDEALRDRVHTAYSVYSRRPIREVWLALRSTLQAKYLVYEHMHCQSRPRKPSCSYLAMWDLKDPGNANRTALCRVFDEYVRILLSGQHQFSPATVALQKYFRWRFTSDGGSYSLFEILDVPT